MVNQPGYQMPGQSNATASGNQNYQQNVIEGAGFAPSFFGTQGAGAQSGQLMSNAATSLLGSQFQAPGQQVGQVQLGAQANQMAGSAGLFGNQGAQAMSGELGTPDQVQTTSEVQSPGPLTPQIKGKQVIGVTEKYSEYGGPYVVVMYGDGSVEEIYEEGPFGGDKKNYNAAKQMAAGGMTGAALGDQFGAIGRYVSPAENELNNLRNRDVTSALRNQLAMQLTALENEQGQAQRQQAARQRGLGFSGISGMDTSGINLMYGQTAGQIQQGALQAIDDAEEAKRISLRRPRKRGNGRRTVNHSDKHIIRSKRN